MQDNSLQGGQRYNVELKRSWRVTCLSHSNQYANYMSTDCTEADLMKCDRCIQENSSQKQKTISFEEIMKVGFDSLIQFWFCEKDNVFSDANSCVDKTQTLLADVEGLTDNIEKRFKEVFKNWKLEFIKQAKKFIFQKEQVLTEYNLASQKQKLKQIVLTTKFSPNERRQAIKQFITEMSDNKAEESIKEQLLKLQILGQQILENILHFETKLVQCISTEFQAEFSSKFFNNNPNPIKITKFDEQQKDMKIQLIQENLIQNDSTLLLQNFQNNEELDNKISLFAKQLQDQEEFKKGQFVGDIVGSIREGLGGIKTDNYQYVGYWKQNKLHGRGIYTWPNQTQYKGDFVMGKLEGYGIKQQQDKQKYVGQFKNDEPDGQGEIYFSDGGWYKGQFKNGRIHGKGEKEHKDKSIYKGEFEEDFYSGHGEFIQNDGGKYIGSFKKGNFNGKGKLTQPNGIFYDGEFENDMFNGEGNLVMPNGINYIGQFKDSAYNGSGILYNKDGNIIKQGRWNNGDFESASQ